jgi:hypothetical protein
MPDNPEPPSSSPPASPPQFQPPSSLLPGEIEARRWNMFCHLSALCGLVFPPVGAVLGPLLIWQIKKHEIPSVEAHGKAALNFQLTILIVVVAGAAAAVPLSFICIGYMFIPVVIAAWLCGIILPIIAGVKANDGIPYKYPFSFDLIK